MIEMKFEIKSIRYRNEESGYTIADIKILNYPENMDTPTATPVVKGTFPAIHKKDEFIGDGFWINSGKYGHQFQLNSHKMSFPETSKGMMDFLTRNINGVGPASAKKIVDIFKEEAFQIILDFPERLSEIKGISQAKRELIHETIKKHRLYEDMALYFLNLGLSHMDVSKIYHKFGYSAITEATENPYFLLSLRGINFKQVDTIAYKLNFHPESRERVKMGVIQFMLDRTNARGDMFTSMKDIFLGLDNFFKNHGGFPSQENLSTESIQEALTELEMENKITTENNVVYLRYYHQVENGIVELLKTKMKRESHPIGTKEDILHFLSERNMTENKESAVLMALAHPFSILSGGPGTGKTFTINAIINSIENFLPGADIKLCAPTGRAAKRMTEMTGKPAETIHKLLKITVSEEEDGSEHFEPIAGDYIIIDESSMIDAHIFYIFLQAIAPETRILLVGDYNQLPSVGPGLILRDLMESKIIPTTILSEIFRQDKDSELVSNAYNIINGKGIDSLTFNQTDFSLTESEDVEKITMEIIKETKTLLKKKISIDDIQILTVLNGGDLGVRELNRKMQQEFNPKNNWTQELRIKADFSLRTGDKVMQTVNNYDLSVFNGETGKIKGFITDNNTLKVLVDFGDRVVAYEKEHLEELSLAYVMSVHKSQGSEFKYVIMPVHQSLRILLHRNIIYTALTRAEKKVFLIGSKDELAKGIDRVENIVRNSRIKEKLQLI